MSPKRRALFTASAVLAIAPRMVLAQEAFPSKAVRIIVPYPPGGFNDTLGRLVATKLTASLGQSVVLENRSGGGTVIGSQAVAMAPPDGHTLLVSQFPFAANPFLYKILPYDSNRSFAPVVLAGRSSMVLLTHAGEPYRTWGELVAAAKANPGKLNYGTSGPGSSNHLAMALFESLTGAHLTQVPYKGSTPLLTDLAAGQVQAAVDLLPNALPFIQTGRVRPLLVAGPRRTPLLPQVPASAEGGLPGYEVSSWHGFMAPAGTPRPVIDRLNREINAILATEEVRKVFAQQGVVPDGGTPEQFRSFIDSQMALWKKVIQDHGITAD